MKTKKILSNINYLLGMCISALGFTSCGGGQVMYGPEPIEKYGIPIEFIEDTIVNVMYGVPSPEHMPLNSTPQSEVDDQITTEE